MCGIAGKISINQTPVDQSGVAAMIQALRHRGPDGQATWSNEHKTVCFGHALLAITGSAEEGRQPMYKHGLTICFNGEIHNHAELAQELGSRPDGPTDTEILLDAWNQWGEDTLNRLNGMWAFALHDHKSKATFLCRDRYGIKPLFLHRDDREITFGSELQALDTGTRFTLNPNPHHYHALLGLDTSQENWLENTESVKPGHLIRISQDGTTQERKWHRPELPEIPEGIRAQAEQLLALLTASCELRRNGPAHPALCLSGGLDSSSLASILCRHRRNPIQTYHVEFPGAANDERQKAKQVANALNLQLANITAEAPHADELERILASSDGPMATPDFIPIWKLHQTLRSHGHKTAIDGMGADELLAGYFLGNQAMQQAWAARSLKQGVGFWKAFNHTYPRAGRWMLGELKRLATGKSKGDRMAVERELKHQFDSSTLPYLLHQYDRMSMAHGIETRMPFLDHRVVDFCQNLPIEAKLGEGETKRILRVATAKMLPPAIIRQKPKIGFTAPSHQWMTGWLKEWALDTAHSTAFLRHPGFDGNNLRKEIVRETNGHEPAGATQREIWAALHTTWCLSKRQAANQP